MWLSIGLLLGAGVTLLTSSFWLPQSGDQSFGGDPLAGVEAEERSLAADDVVAAADAATGAADVVAAGADGIEPAQGEADPGDQASITAESGQTSSSQDDDVEILLGEHQDDSFAAAPQPTARPGDEPADEIGVGSTVETLTVAETGEERDPGEAVPASLDPSEALAALARASEPASQTEEPAVRGRDDRPVGNDADTRKPSPLRPNGADVAARTAPADDARPPRQDDANTAANAGPDTGAATGPASANDRADLPPRIRQALQAAERARENGSDADGLYRVQLAAVDDEAAARVFWREVNDRLPGVFDDVEPIFNRREVDERLFYQVWVGTFADLSVASGYCGWLQDQGQDCFVTQVDRL